MKTSVSFAVALMATSSCVLASFASAAPKSATSQNTASKKGTKNSPTPTRTAKRPAVLLAQNPAQRPPTAAPGGVLNTTITQAEQTQDSETLLLAYGQAATDPTLARQAISQLLSNFYTLRNQAQTPQQASQAIDEASLRFQVFQTAQNQIIIQQNQQLLQQNAQMIQLLQRATGAAAPR